MPTARSARLESAVKGFFKSISNLPFKIVRFLSDSSESIRIYYNISSIYYYALSRKVLVPIGIIGEIKIVGESKRKAFDTKKIKSIVNITRRGLC